MVVETTHYNLASVISQLIATEPDAYTDEERWLAIIPFYHIYGALLFVFLSRKLLSLASINIICNLPIVPELVA
jgi:long-subunit acyl-CoA synthetase (AMP-forming)